MAPVKIRYHVPYSPTPDVVRYNDPLEDRHHQRPNRAYKKRRRDRRDNVSDTELDYSPRPLDFEHMRKSVPDKYWGPYNPYVYQKNKRWETEEDAKFYDFKYESNRHHPHEDEHYRSDSRYRPDYGNETHYDNDPYNHRHYHGHDTDRHVGDYDYDRRYEPERVRADYARHPRDYNDIRYVPKHEPVEYERGEYTDRRPPSEYQHQHHHIGHRYGRGYDTYRRDAQTEVILPRDRKVALPYMGSPTRKQFEHRRASPDRYHYRYRPRMDYDYPRHRPPHHHYHHNHHNHHQPHHRDDGDSYYSSPEYVYERTGYTPEARVAVIRPIKAHKDQACEACPHKSSKYIPSMHYDELRCRDCQERVQPGQGEIMAYPWTVQSFRPPAEPTLANMSTITPSVYTRYGGITLRSMKQGEAYRSPQSHNGLTELMKANSQAGVSRKPDIDVKSNIGGKTNISAKHKEEKANDDNNNNDVYKNKENVASHKSAASLANQARPVPTPKPNSMVSQNDKENANNKNKSKNKSKSERGVTQPSKNGRNSKQTNGVANGVVPVQHKAETPSKPLFRTGALSNNQRQSIKGQRSQAPGLATVREDYEDLALDLTRDDDSMIIDSERGGDFDEYDDIRPQDSISNVRLPPLRAYPQGPNNSSHQRLPQPRAETELTAYSYPSGRYFPSYEYIPPPPAQATPLPRHEPITPAPRQMRGHYVDRVSGRKYEYDVRYHRRRIHGERRPVR